MIKVTLTQSDGKIEWLRITGDFFLHPEDLIEEMERVLISLAIDEEEIGNSIEELIEKRNGTLVGVAPADIARCIMMAGDLGG
ncbi:MAG: lipoate protein ligase C-terminal domain-containing protein [Candidatus Bathyarchaeia archaeon]